MEDYRTENSTLPTSLNTNIEVETQHQPFSPEMVDSNLSSRSMEVFCKGGLSALAYEMGQLVERSGKVRLAAKIP